MMEGTVVTLWLTECGVTTSRRVPYALAVKFIGTGFQRVKIVDPVSDVVLDLEQIGIIRSDVLDP